MVVKWQRGHLLDTRSHPGTAAVGTIETEITENEIIVVAPVDVAENLPNDEEVADAVPVPVLIRTEIHDAAVAANTAVANDTSPMTALTAPATKTRIPTTTAADEAVATEIAARVQPTRTTVDADPQDLVAASVIRNGAITTTTTGIARPVPVAVHRSARDPLARGTSAITLAKTRIAIAS